MTTTETPTMGGNPALAGRRGAKALLGLVLVSCLGLSCSTDGDDGTREGATPTTGPEDTSTAESTGRYGGSADESHPLDIVDVRAEDVRHAREFLETLVLPDEPLPVYLIELQRLQARCIEDLGFPISEHLDQEVALELGMWVFTVGEQGQRFNEVSVACDEALDELGLWMGTGRDANERLYEIYLESQQCLETNGFPTVEPPTLESFVEAPWAWYPWEALLPSGSRFAPTPDFLVDDRFRPYVESVEVCPRP